MKNKFTINETDIEVVGKLIKSIETLTECKEYLKQRYEDSDILVNGNISTMSRDDIYRAYYAHNIYGNTAGRIEILTLDFQDIKKWSQELMDMYVKQKGE